MVGLFKTKREEPIEHLSTEALCARLGLPVERPTAKQEVPLPLRPEYLRVDGPRPALPRSWRGGPAADR